MSGTFFDYWRLVKPAPPKSQYSTDNTQAAHLYSNFSWYTKVMKGSASRFGKYSQYRNMDSDVFVARCLDTIAEEMSPTDIKTNLPFEIIYQNESNEDIPDVIIMTIRAALRHWVDIQDFNTMLFDLARTTIKYGDCFFRKTSDFKKWKFVDPGDVIGISINEDNVIEAYHMRVGEKSKSGAFGDVVLVPAAGMVQFSLSSAMNDSGPFGDSVLLPTIKAYRHLTLLEDAVIIYRIVRAPERRVFSIDTGNMPAQRAQAYLESIKNSLRQKRIPNESGGNEKVDSVYNPMSMQEDFFFAKSGEGRGSSVDTLSGGENLGEISDLNYFQNKFLQGLRIPSSYMRGGQDATGQLTDGKVGIAYIEELRFANYVNRLQNKISDTFDLHFKQYLKSAGINVDTNLFKIKLVVPQNFQEYQQSEIDEKRIGNFSNLKEVKYLSKRFALRRYLGLSEEEIQENEALLKQETGIPDGGVSEKLDEIRMLYDDNWIENRPDIKADESLNDFTAETKKGGAEEPTEEPEPDGPVEGEAGGGAPAAEGDAKPEKKGDAEPKEPKKDDKAEPKKGEEPPPEAEPK